MELVDRDADMAHPLKDLAFFADCFLELGAPCWRDGLELRASSLHRKLVQRGTAHGADAAQRGHDFLAHADTDRTSAGTGAIHEASLGDSAADRHRYRRDVMAGRH